MIGSSRSPALFVSPHFDDVALSCGGTVARASTGAGAHVVTVFAGDVVGGLNEFAVFQHNRWGADGDVVDERRQEDAAALRRLGARSQWLDFPDAIYRDRLYLSDEELFGEVRPKYMGAATAVVDSLVTLANAIQPSRVYLPLAVGSHVDHQICLMSARPLLDAGHDLWFYEDFPYAATAGAVERAVESFDVALAPVLVNVTDVLDARLAAIQAYTSQLPTIFRNYGPFADVVRAHAEALSGERGRFVERFWRYSC